ncbi:hypothetical protein C5748_18510 [Phyllobacterium phragmitis]|uniref:Uncharacterized protein n=1 Tax=Phyllobacterium phragmitis TaxID=2670329 RepID=A0A2S9INP6_9HYPH|nr:hypothetical protein [Phyllobacterium phragmitis]PRD42141.1 hypothetical protein C5748_18510 [Phyllobacterium phragmitis]
MAVLSDYVAGTITVTAGQDAFTGTGTLWRTAGFREGDTVQLQDLTAVIAGTSATDPLIASNTSGTFTEPWQGTSGTFPYRMRYLPDGARYTAKATQLIEKLGNGNIEALADLPGAADMLAYFTGAGAMDLTALTAFGRSLIGASNGGDAYSALGEVPDAQIPPRIGALALVATDLNAITESGIYGADSDTANRPGDTGNWLVLDLARTSTVNAQLALSRATYDIQYRYNNGTTQQPWRGILTERGTNANGDYTRFPDGTQICWRNYVANSAASWPAAFSAAPFAVATVAGGGLPRIATFPSSPTATTVTVQVNTENGGASSSPGYVVGFGRWF